MLKWQCIKLAGYYTVGVCWLSPACKYIHMWCEVRTPSVRKRVRNETSVEAQQSFLRVSSSQNADKCRWRQCCSCLCHLNTCQCHQHVSAQCQRIVCYQISLSPQNASVCETLKANPFRTGGCPLLKTLLSSSLVKSQCHHHRVGWVGGKNEGV